ncbi:MAG TPA: helix-turn-helix transcriptional regulator [Roseomonas sp.]
MRMVCPDLVERIYDAALDGADWHAATHGLMDAIGGVQGLLLRFDATTHNPVGLAGSISDDLVALCQAQHHANPWTDAVMRAGPGRIVSMDRHMRLGEIEKTGFYADVLRPGGVAHGAGVMLRADDDAWLGIAFGRGRGGGPFGAAQMDLLEAYLPHMRRALALADRFDGLAQVRRAELEALDMLGAAALLVDDAGRVLLANRAARALDAGGALLLAPGRAPACADRDAAAAFQSAVAAAASGLAPPPIRFRDALDTPLIMIAAPLGGAAADRLSFAGMAGRAAAVLFLITATGGAGPSIPLLQALWGLTPAEARVAAELALGDGEADAARRLGIALSSLKTHRQRIFEKTGVTRRGQLVRLLARLPSGPR